MIISVVLAQDPPVTLVLDDFHLLTDSAVLDGLDYVLRNTGAGLRLVVSARTDPLLPLHRYRLAGQLTQIRAGDLAFSVAEAGLLLARHGQAMPADSLERLTRRTEGWAAGLRLAALGMGAHPGSDRFVMEELVTEDSAVTGYLVHEVLNTQPPQAREVPRPDRSANASRKCYDTSHACSAPLRSPARCTSPSIPSRRTSPTSTASWQPPAAPRRSAAAASLS